MPRPKGKNIKKPATSKGKNIKIPQERAVNYDVIPAVFSLRYIQQGNFCFDKMNHQQKSDFAEALYKRRGCTWRELYTTDRKGLGTENIHESQINAPRPNFLKEDVDKYNVLRFSINPARIVGFREENIFYILWIDCKGDLYDHGS